MNRFLTHLLLISVLLAIVGCNKPIREASSRHQSRSFTNSSTTSVSQPVFQ